MEERIPELLALTIVMLAAVSMGLVLARLRQPPIVGYIMAGILLGPAGIGLVPQAASIPLFAELGVLMLLFVIGMEISLRAFILDLRPAVLTVFGQLVAAGALTFLLGTWFGWSLNQIMLMAFVITMSSTAVALKMLEDINELRSEIGRIAVAVLVAQDIAVVPMLILARSLGDESGITLDAFLTVVLAVGILVMLIRVLGRPGKLNFPGGNVISGRVELVTLMSLAICFSAATATGLLHLSPAYGAFVAGLIVGKTKLRSEAIHALEPIQSVLMVIFFMSIGLLLDISFIIDRWPLVLAFVIGVLVLKSLVNIALLRAVGMPWATAVTAGLVMGQIGEFSFVLASVGLSTLVLDEDGYRLAIAVIALSLLVSPLWMSAVRRVHDAAGAGLSDFRVALSAIYAETYASIDTTQRISSTTRLKLARRAARETLRRTREKVAKPAASGIMSTPATGTVKIEEPDAARSRADVEHVSGDNADAAAKPAKTRVESESA